jgi:putative nucleotidyltransferase with HDIG domain
MYNVNMNESLRVFVKDIKNLPTIPVIAEEILNLFNNDMLSLEKLETIVERDPAISAKVLSLANSAFFGFQVTTDALGRAMMRIGFNIVKNIALAISLMTILDDGKRSSAFDYKRVFNHSVSVGFTASLLSKNLKLKISDEPLMIGMLHDLGYLVLSRYFPEKYEEVLLVFEKEKTLLDAEKKALDFTHADIGMWLAEEWNLPDIVKDVNLFHHTPSIAKRNEQQVALIHIADYLTAKNIISPTEIYPNYSLDPYALKILGISENDLKDLEETLGGIPFDDEIFK